MQITRLHTPLFFQKSTLLRGVTSAFRICSYCHITICASLIFLLIWRICFYSGPLPMIFVATTFFRLVNLKELPTILTAFLTFKLNSGMHCRTFFVLVFFFRLINKIQGRVVQSIQSKFSFILFAYNLMIGYSKRIEKIIRENAFEQKKKKPRLN